MYRMMSDILGSGSGIDTYTFGDETRLKLQSDKDPDATNDLKVTDPGFNLETNKSINTAWRYPVDTNNDGAFDTFTLYGIFFRSPHALHQVLMQASSRGKNTARSKNATDVLWGY
jgi:hypothetical protein